MERNEMRKKALGLPASSQVQQPTVDKENKIQESNIKKDPAPAKKAMASPRKSNQTASNELVRASSGKTPVKTVSSKKEDADVAVEINITSSQSIQVEVEVAECEIDENGKMIKKGESTINSLSNFDYTSSSSMSEHSRRNLKRLGVLYSDTDQISSPIQRTEENFCESKVTGGRPMKKFSKLAALADDINSWDDDYSHHSTQVDTQSPMKSGAAGSPFKNSTASPYKNTTASPFKKAIGSPKSSLASNVPKPPPFSFGGTSSPSTKNNLQKGSKDSPKKLIWDKKVMDSLEAQGFSRRESAIPKLVYDYSNDKPSTSTGGSTSSPAKKSLPKQAPNSTTSSNSSVPKPSVSSPAKKEIAKPTVSSPAKREVPKPSQIKQGNVRASNMFAKRDQKDPAEMSLKERMAIFEKNKGKPPVPATQFGITDANPIRSNMPELSKKFDFGFKKNVAEKEVKEGTVENASGNIKSTVSQLLTKKVTTISEKQISDEIRKQREEDMKCIMSRYNKPSSEISSENDGDETMSDEKGERKRRSSNEESSDTKDVEEKKARISNPARLYPVLSDFETTDSEMDNYTTATVSASEAEKPEDEETQSTDESDEENPRLERMSIGREILNSVRKNNDLSNHSYLESTISSADVSDAMNDMDDYLNEALEEDNESQNYDDKGSACSDSFEYARYPKRVSFKEVNKGEEFPVKSKVEISPAKSPQGSMTLVHTVSFYRRQQASANNTPIKKVVHKPDVDSEDDDFSYAPTQNNRKQREECDAKIQRLLDEVMRQQAVIKQTSQALNLCASTFEFSGSTEAVEGERHLLVATHRRIACLNEVQRLKCEGLIDRTGREKGNLTIQEIIIPLKQTYISRLASNEISGHNLMCLVKYNEYVLASKTLPTLPGLKSVKFTDNLTFNEVFADFKVIFLKHFFLIKINLINFVLDYIGNLWNDSTKRSSST